MVIPSCLCSICFALLCYFFTYALQMYPCNCKGTCYGGWFCFETVWKRVVIGPISLCWSGKGTTPFTIPCVRKGYANNRQGTSQTKIVVSNGYNE
jgi:hypothetical protein